MRPVSNAGIGGKYKKMDKANIILIALCLLLSFFSGPSVLIALLVYYTTKIAINIKQTKYEREVFYNELRKKYNYSRV